MPKTDVDVSRVKNETGELFFNLRSDYETMECYARTHEKPTVLIDYGHGDIALVNATNIVALVAKLINIDVEVTVVWSSVDHPAIESYKEGGCQNQRCNI
jgi:hypothetical protein